MAEKDLHVSSQPEVDSEQDGLKYLNVVQKAAQHAVPYASKAYDYAKENSGSLKPGMEKIEGALKTNVGPAYETLHDVPSEVLKFADNKVDDSVTKAKSTSVAADIKNVGVVETASGLTKSAYTKVEPIANELSAKYKPVAEQHAASAWQSLNKLPLVSDVAKVTTPTAAYVSKKDNETVQQKAEEGRKVFKSPGPEAEPVVPCGAEGADVGH